MVIDNNQFYGIRRLVTMRTCWSHLIDIIENIEGVKFSPKTEFTRAQIAQVLYNIDNIK